MFLWKGKGKEGKPGNLFPCQKVVGAGKNLTLFPGVRRLVDVARREVVMARKKKELAEDVLGRGGEVEVKVHRIYLEVRGADWRLVCRAAGIDGEGQVGPWVRVAVLREAQRIVDEDRGG
jgi:hypothetical protein